MSRKDGGLASDATLRDAFAAAALQGMLSGDWSDDIRKCVEKAFLAADLMIAQRKDSVESEVSDVGSQS